MACVATAANVNDTVMFERLFLSAWAVLARIGTVFADKGYDAEHHRELCRRFHVEPHIHRRGQPHGSYQPELMLTAIRLCGYSYPSLERVDD